MSLWLLAKDKDGKDYREYMVNHPRDIGVQTLLSAVLGVSAFLTFCFLRPRWTQLYAARKQQKDAAARLPELPKSMFGWIPILYRIPESEVLASAGLDAFVFLSFFNYAIKFLTIVLFFSLVVILPINGKLFGKWNPLDRADDDPDYGDAPGDEMAGFSTSGKDGLKTKLEHQEYLWMYVVFAYFFTWLALYLLVLETKKIIKIRQSYLGSQSTVTDRTLRLSGIPVDMRSEDQIQEFIENLEIGKVYSVMLCRDWTYLDDLIIKRTACLRKLEEALTIHFGYKKVGRNGGSLPIVQPPPPECEIHPDDDEHSHLLAGSDLEQIHVASYKQDRPMARIWYGPFKMQSHKVDAIDYYEEKLRKLDESVQYARNKEYKPTSMAFVTMESTAACQMAVQAILDPTPGNLLAGLAPPPADVLWENTYLSRQNRMVRSWSIMIFIGLLTIFWAALLVPVAGLLNPQTIGKVFPGFEDFLRDHKVLNSLVTTGLPTLFLSILTVVVPFLYAYLASLQGMTSQGDTELSIISKNFFFTFFSLFLVFTSLGTFSNFYGLFENLREVLKDTTAVALALAKAVRELLPFYTNFIILQGLGLFPFRLLEFGTVSLYPFYLIGAKTPRDYADLLQAPIFSYGFYLPQTQLIFIVCLVYSVIPLSWLLVLCGVIYFCVGSFVYKYQLLYAMDHRQHSTGRAWPMICNRVVVGLVVFQLVMIGFLALNTAIKRSTAVVPALVGTIWFSLYFQRTYTPLMKFIALRSIQRDNMISMPSRPESRWDADTNNGRNVDTNPETGLRYLNPNLYEPLEKLWIRKGLANGSSH